VEASVSYSEVSTATAGGMAGPLVSALSPSTGSLCLDDFHSLTSAGNVIDIYTCNQSGARAWTVNPDGTLHVLGNRRCQAQLGLARGHRGHDRHHLRQHRRAIGDCPQ
jgi:hypothetical protein